jgi:lipopolysaccharide/colanic/teichoic acid biosynthesis glycosyltransferase
MKNELIRAFDILISILLLVVLFPLILLISILILIFDGRPIFFTQTRIGQHGKKFKIFKFRTMKSNSFKNENLRLTRIGKIIRRLSFDEIPQFFNVLKNDMSIVGPRPLPEINEKKIKSSFKIKRRKILPGITGLSQIHYNGKYRKLDDKVKLDIKFVNSYSVYNYFKILLNTPIVLIIRLLKNKSSIIR